MQDEDYTDEEFQQARQFTDKFIGMVREAAEAENLPPPKALAEALMIVAAGMWNVAFDDPNYKKLNEYLVGLRADVKMLDTVRGLNLSPRHDPPK